MAEFSTGLERAAIQRKDWLNLSIPAGNHMAIWAELRA